MIALHVIRESPVVNNIVILPIRREDAIMARSGADIVISLEDLGRGRTEGTSWRRTSYVANAVGIIAPPVTVSFFFFFFSLSWTW